MQGTRRSRGLLVAVLSVVLSAVWAVPARAVDAVQTTQVSAVPSTATPNINDGRVTTVAQVDGKILVGGSFTNASPPGVTGGAQATSQPYLLAFDPSTGQLDQTFRPKLDGTVQQIQPGPTATTAYLAGSFATVNGAKSRGVALVDVTTGALVAGWKPALNGAGWTVRLYGSELLVGGTFTSIAGQPRGGLASLNPTTGALDSYLTVSLADHHNWTSGCSNCSFAPVGARRMDVSPDGTRLVVVGNFKHADGLLRDQIVLIDLGVSSTNVDPGWATAGFSAACAYASYDTYVRDVKYSPDGRYFVVGTTGGGGTGPKNTDGTRALCDSASRWEAGATGSDVQPTWADWTGNDSFESITSTANVIYVGGHQRWVNNYFGSDSAGPGALPRPGIVALDPANGLPFTWNPGRNPRGAGAYAAFATPDGLYVGSDTNYIGNRKYYRGRIAFFPLTGGAAIPPNATGQLPGTVYLVGPGGTPANTVVGRAFDGTTVGTTSQVDASRSWSNARGAFMVDGTVFYGWSDGNLYRSTFDGSTFGPATLVDPYHDPYWDGVDTGSGNTYDGVFPTLYGSETQGITGMVWSAGRLYYTRSGKSGLYWRYFTPQSGVTGDREFTSSTSLNLSSATGIFLSGSTLYWGKSDGTLHAVSWNGGAPVAATDTTVSGPNIDGNDWHAKGMFLKP